MTEQDKRQLIANTLKNVETLINDTPLSKKDREYFMAGMEAIVDELNAQKDVSEDVRPFPHVPETVEVED